MIYLFCGSDDKRVLTKFQNVLEKLKAKRPNTSIYSFTADNFEVEMIENLLQADSLFEAKYILAWQNLISGEKKNEEREEQITDLLKLAQISPHIVLWREGELTAKQKTTFSKQVEKVEEFEAKSKTGQDFNLFALADYLGEGRKQEAWLFLNEGFNKGKAADELLIPILYFTKTLALVSTLKNGETADLKPFVLSKYKKFAQKIGKEKAIQKYTELLEAVAEARTIAVPLSTKLEGWVLGW